MRASRGAVRTTLAEFRAAFANSLAGLRGAARSERAVRQELWVLALALPTAPLVADGLWSTVALYAVLLLVLAVELLNTATEKLCDRLHPDRDPAIGHVKDLGSAAVLSTLLLAGLVWGAALLQLWRRLAG